MSAATLNLWDLEAAILARIQAAAPAGVAINTTFDATDWTADDAPRVGGQLVFDGFGFPDRVGGTALATTRWSFHSFLAAARANAADKTRAQQLVLACIRAIAGWEWRAGNEARLTDSPQTGFDGQLARVSVSFTVPAPIAGISQE